MGLKAKNRIHEKIARVQKVSNNYSVYLHLGEEEDLSFLIRILYHWETESRKMEDLLPKTFEDVEKLLKKKKTQPVTSKKIA